VIDDPRPFYDQLRREAPVWQIPGQHSYLVSDPVLIREVVGRTSEFSSNFVSLLHRDASGVPVAFDLVPLGDPIHVLATADPPVHTRHRRLLQPHLNAQAVAAMEPMLAQVAEEQLAPLLMARRGDIVACLSEPLPAIAICRLLGLPRENAARIIPLVAEMGVLLDGVADRDGMSRAFSATVELFAFARSHIDAMRNLPAAERSGLLAVLSDGVESHVLTSEEAQGILVQLFSAGTETTGSLIATATETLARRVDLQEQLRCHPERIPGAIEEILRDDGPFQFYSRWTTTDTRLGDKEIPANSRVLLMWAAANRPDPRQSGSGEQDRNETGPVAHYAFGRGLHFCIGVHLARLEARIAIERLLAQTSRFVLDPDEPPTRRPSYFLRRHTSLNITIE
jgi:cytochrome P450